MVLLDLINLAEPMGAKMSSSRYIKVRMICYNCRYEVNTCVYLEGNFPIELYCDHDQHISPGRPSSTYCILCNHYFYMKNDQSLRQQIRETISKELSTCQRNGYVSIIID